MDGASRRHTRRTRKRSAWEHGRSAVVHVIHVTVDAAHAHAPQATARGSSAAPLCASLRLQAGITNNTNEPGLKYVPGKAQHMYLALEYADSGSLQQCLDAAAGGRLSEDWACWFFQQLVYGLAHCHAHGVYNRDIKPENLLLHTHGGRLRLPLLKVRRGPCVLYCAPAEAGLVPGGSLFVLRARCPPRQAPGRRLPPPP